MPTGAFFDVLTRITNVQWGGGVFSFAGNISLTVVTPPSGTGLGSSDIHFSWLGGTSSDGKTWQSGGPTDADLDLFCCVRGKIEKEFIVIAAGSIVVGPFNFGPGYAVSDGVVPGGGISRDDGKTWGNAGIPVQNHILSPPNPVTGQGAHTASGNCNAVAYHPGLQTFYVGGSVIFNKGADIYFEDRMYSGSTEFSQMYSERRELFDPFPGYRWPAVTPDPETGEIKPGDRLRVADMTLKTVPGPDIAFAVSFGPEQHVDYTDKKGDKLYVSVKEDGTGATLGDADIFPPMAVVNSICGGLGYIVAVGWEDEDRRIGPITYVSADDGVSWTQQLSGLKHTNPGPEDNNSGSSSGSCSFGAE